MFSTLAIASALLSAAFWAVASVAISRFLAGGLVSPAAANLFKNTAAAFTFLLGALIFGGHWPVGAAWAWLFLSGFLGFAVADTLYFAAFQRCGVQTAATVMLLNVPIATILALPLAGDEIKTQVIPFAVVVLVGVLLVIFDSRMPRARSGVGTQALDGTASPGGGYGVGVLLAVVAAFAIGTSVPLGRGSFSDVSVFPGGFIRLAGGAVGAIPMALLGGFRRGSSSGTEISRLLEPIFAAPGPGSVWGRASLIGVGCAIVGLGPYHYAQRELESGIATTLFASTPLFTLPLAFFMGSRVGWKGVLGTVIGFLGVAGILTYGQDRPVEVRKVEGPGPTAELQSQGSHPARQGGRKPSFIRSLPSLDVDLWPFVALVPAQALAPADGKGAAVAGAPAGRSGGLTPVEVVPVQVPVDGAPLPTAAIVPQSRHWPMLFGDALAGLASPRRILEAIEPPRFDRGQWSDRPFGARLATGDLLVGTAVTIGEGDGDNTYGIRLFLEVDGPPALDLGWLHTDSSEVQHGYGAVVPLDTGGAQMVWIDDRGGEAQPGMALYRRALKADGSLAAEELVDPFGCDCCPPDLEELPDGTLVVAYRHLAADNVRDIYLSRRDPRGGAWSPPSPVHDDGWKVSACPNNGPAVASTERVVAVAWFTQAGVGEPQTVKVAFSRDQGRTFGSPVTVIDGATLGRVELVSVQSSPSDERFLLVHMAVNGEEGQPGADASWSAVLIHPSGFVSEPGKIADVPGIGSSGRLDLVRVGPGEAQAVWVGPKGLGSANLLCGPEWTTLDGD